MTSHVKEKLDNVMPAIVSNLQIEQNGNEDLMERLPKEYCRKTGNMLKERK